MNVLIISSFCWGLGGVAGAIIGGSCVLLTALHLYTVLN